MSNKEKFADYVLNWLIDVEKDQLTGDELILAFAAVKLFGLGTWEGENQVFTLKE